ncbi:MAG: TrkH family potassium uptake protein [Beijerinckiaceae bacterium]
MSVIAFSGLRIMWQRQLIARPMRLIVVGYLTYVLVGSLLLSLPAAQKTPVPLLDNFFISTSAVSTTGLVTVDPGGSYTVFGQFIILGLIQFGGLGYMTIGSIALMAIGHQLSDTRRSVGRTAFGLPVETDVPRFIRYLIVYTLAVEVVGAMLLWPHFQAAGIDNALWSAVFHSVSAFCTAGFSLNADSFTRFAGNSSVLAIISILSILGAIGFFVVADVWRRIFLDGKALSLTSLLVLPVTFGALLMGTATFLYFEPAIAALPIDQQVGNAFFQSMTAATTVGFNTVDTAKYVPAAMIFSYIIMLIGASPAGTGGGLKTTTIGIMAAACVAAIRGKADVVIHGRRIPALRLVQALALALMWAGCLALAMFILALNEKQAFDILLFESISAMATVGLSMGATAELTAAGKVVIIALMFIGRVGVIAFFIAFARGANVNENNAKEQDVLL